MCQHIIAKTGQRCKNKKEPYCHLHAPKAPTCPLSTLPKASSSSLPCGGCPICTDTSSLVEMPCCKQNICRDCLILTGSLSCSFCRAVLTGKIDKRIEELIKVVKSKDDKIKKLEYENHTLRLQIQEYESDIPDELQSESITIPVTIELITALLGKQHLSDQQ